MTPEQLAEIKARAEKATPGPWKAVEGGSGIHKGNVLCVEERSESGWEVIFTGFCGAYEGHGLANAELVAHARTDIPALLEAYTKAVRDHTELESEYWAVRTRLERENERLTTWLRVKAKDFTLPVDEAEDVRDWLETEFNERKP